MLFFPSVRTAFGAEAPSPPSQKAVIQEIVRVANKYIDHRTCKPTRIETSSVATMSPYMPDVEAGRAAAEYVVIWTADGGCHGGSGTHKVYLLVEKRGVTPASIVGEGEFEDAASIERIVAATPDNLTVDGYTWGPDDAQCCASVYERWTFRRAPAAQPGHYTLELVDSKPVEPVPRRPGEKKLPTAKMDQ